MLRRFAKMIKWPNLAATLDGLARFDDEGQLDALGADAFAFFSGLVLPGVRIPPGSGEAWDRTANAWQPAFPFLIMNALIDMDPDRAAADLTRLPATAASQHCGFQYRNSHTYWSAGCIVGKVLAPTCRGVAGWVGPGRPTADLGRTQTVRIRSRRPRDRGRGMVAEHVESMEERSDPLGPEAETYPVDDYELAAPQTESGFVVDAVRIEMLGFKPATTGTASAISMKTTATPAYDASVQFAIGGLSWPLRLTYDVDFVAAWPCSDGPHPLFFDYVFRTVRVDEVVHVRDWGQLSGGRGPRRSDDDGDSAADDEEVLVIEAFGVRDNEVLARAWCSHWGLSAVVADINRTWYAALPPHPRPFSLLPADARTVWRVPSEKRTRPRWPSLSWSTIGFAMRRTADEWEHGSTRASDAWGLDRIPSREGEASVGDLELAETRRREMAVASVADAKPLCMSPQVVSYSIRDLLVTGSRLGLPAMLLHVDVKTS